MVGGFRNGFRLGYKGPLSSTFRKNSISVHSNLAAAKAKVEEERSLGRLAGPFRRPPFAVFKCSPLSLRAKQTPGKFRLLHDLSAPYDDNAVNRNIPDADAKVSYPTVEDAIAIISRLERPFMAKADLKDAYRQIPLAPDQYWLVGFQLEKQFYHDLRLPMGARSSCAIFERVTNALAHILRTKYGVRYLVKLLDDFLFIGESKAECARALAAFENLCESLGLPLATEKTEPPGRRVTFLGITLDSERKEASLPEGKASRYSEEARALAKKDSCSLRDLREITGKLEHVTTIIPGGRAFIRRLHWAKRGPQRPGRTIRLYQGHRADLRTWVAFLRENNARSLFRFITGEGRAELKMGSDASKKGFGGFLGPDCIAGSFPKDWQSLTIEALELYPILVLVGTFEERLRDKEVVVACDNLPLVHCLNKMTSRNRQVMALMRLLVLVLMRANATLRAEHIRSHDNWLADVLSRHQVTGEWLRRHGMASELTPIPPSLTPEGLRPVFTH